MDAVSGDAVPPMCVLDLNADVTHYNSNYTVREVFFANFSKSLLHNSTCLGDGDEPNQNSANDFLH